MSALWIAKHTALSRLSVWLSVYQSVSLCMHTLVFCMCTFPLCKSRRGLSVVWTVNHFCRNIMNHDTHVHARTAAHTLGHSGIPHSRLLYPHKVASQSNNKWQDKEKSPHLCLCSTAAEEVDFSVMLRVVCEGPLNWHTCDNNRDFIFYVWMVCVGGCFLKYTFFYVRLRLKLFSSIPFQEEKLSSFTWTSNIHVFKPLKMCRFARLCLIEFKELSLKPKSVC